MATATKIGGPTIAAMNIVNNMEVWQLWGDNAVVGTSYEGVNGSNADEQHPAILGEDVDILSSSSADDEGSTGAEKVIVRYLDSNFRQQEEEVILNGTSAVELVNQTITFINDVRVSQTGSGLAAAGALDIAQPGGNTMGTLDAGATHWNNTKCMVPVESQGFIYGFWGDIVSTADGAGVVQFALQIAEFGSSGVANSETWQTIGTMTVVDYDDDVVQVAGGNAGHSGFFNFPGGLPFVVPAKCMVRLAVKSGTAGALVTGGFSILIAGENAGTVTTES